MGEVKMQIENYFNKADLERHRTQYNTMLASDELDKCHLSNFLWNLPIMKNYPGILGFEGVFKGNPVVMVGSGPSLDKNMHLLKQYQKKMIIIAGDAALPYLAEQRFPTRGLVGEAYMDVVVGCGCHVPEREQVGGRTAPRVIFPGLFGYSKVSLRIFAVVAEKLIRWARAG